MTATEALTTDLKRLVLDLEDDLRARLEDDPATREAWRSEHREAIEASRTAASWQEFRDDRITQVAVAWVLTTVFIRFCEDNSLVRPVWFTGPGPRHQEALDAQLAYFREKPEHTDREWILQGITYLKELPATAALVDDRSPLWMLSPSGTAATTIIDFWRERDIDGELIHDLTDPELSTRFLGDMYQDLSDYARSTFALLQTPEFVEEFILDQTMEPALAERPLEGFKIIDPTCGSGHFLLGAFARLRDRWLKKTDDGEEAVRNALSSVFGVDINPFAVAIARFRLTIAAMESLGLKSLEDAPELALNLAAGDSLLHGGQGELALGLESSSHVFSYATEDGELLDEILTPGSYDAVVGNPPYITVKDKVLNRIYRNIYSSCHGGYALSVPFMERFFQLARTEEEGSPAGWSGQITSNSFMKREFGVKLIEQFIVTKDLHLIVDSEGAWIPGHNMDGTPTIILVGQNRSPRCEKVRTVLSMGKRETLTNTDGSGPYWQGILQNLYHPGHEDEWISIADLPRSSLASHPWSLTGGGAVELTGLLNDDRRDTLDSKVQSIGFGAITGEDTVFIADTSPPSHWEREGIPIRPLVIGESVRDFSFAIHSTIIYPYETGGPIPHLKDSSAFWKYRTSLRAGTAFGRTREEAGRLWTEYILPNELRLNAKQLISFAFVATHNHFVLDRGGKVFKQSAPVIKLPEDATEDNHLELLGILNSSIAGFWMKQNSQPKGGAAGIPWLRTYEFTGTTLKDFPLPDALPLERAQLLDALAQEAAAQTPHSIVKSSAPSAALLEEARATHANFQWQMIAQQEELDWEVYRLYGIVDDDLTYTDSDLPKLALGERAFEIVLARQVEVGVESDEWFKRHGSAPITEIPSHWPEAYRDLVQRRIDLIESDRFIKLLERPEYKRRWSSVPWEEQQEEALRNWLLDRLEDEKFWFDRTGRPTPKSIGQLADEVARDEELMAVLTLWEGRHDVTVTDSLTKLMTDESVPYLAALRLKESGMRKRQAWEETWWLQRKEDAGEHVGTIPVPPKYTSADFRKTAWWRHRGKLDVPKERFIQYPDAGRATDPTLLLGWAGWDHAQQALALSIIAQDRTAEGFENDQLLPLAAGLNELQPWVDQWHSEIDPNYGVSMAEFTREQLHELTLRLGVTTDDLAAWRPPAPTRGRRRK